MGKKPLIVVALALSLVAGAFVAAQPAVASVTVCTDPPVKVVNNSHGRLEVDACVRHTDGKYYSWGEYNCFFSLSAWGQDCNIAATQTLWYNATAFPSDDVHGCGLDGCPGDFTYHSFQLSGSPQGCTSAKIHSSITNIQVRFQDGTLWNASTSVSSGTAAGSFSC